MQKKLSMSHWNQQSLQFTQPQGQQMTWALASDATTNRPQMTSSLKHSQLESHRPSSVTNRPVMPAAIIKVRATGA